MQPTMPPADSPTVELRLGGRYVSHHRQTIYEVVGRDARGFIVRNLDNGHEDRLLPNGRRSANFTTWSDLIEEAQ